MRKQRLQVHAHFHIRNRKLIHILYVRKSQIMHFRTHHHIINEPRHEKTCLRGLRTGKTQIGLPSYRN